MRSRQVIRAGVALLALVAFAACRGGEKSAAPAAGASSTSAAPEPAGGALAAPATGKVWDVKMFGDNQGYRFDPKALTIRAGDAVRWVFVSGGPHDVTFWADSIPKGAQAPLQAHMSNTIAPLMAPMTMNQGDSYTVSFAGLPPGIYRYYCTPHLAMGMVATLTVK